jgi:GT2 family glycosyltransferase
VDYSIVIPVFNKAELTRNCLETLRATLEGAGTGEVIVIDNASSDETPEMLESFPWVRVVRNERNLGFAGANNQGARLATGRFLVLLNNDTQGLPGWLAAMLRVAADPQVGVVGARLLYPDDTIQHAGVVVAGAFFGRTAFSPFHTSHRVPAEDRTVTTRREYQIVTGACMVTPRELYLELGGLDETYWNGYEDVDYCLKARERGLAVVYEPAAKLYHFESQSGAQRFRKVWWNVRTLAQRWAGKVRYDSLETSIAFRTIAMLDRIGGDQSLSLVASPTPATAVLVHGACPPDDRARFETMLRSNHSPISAILWCESNEAIAAARAAMAVRGERYLALVHAASQLDQGWLDQLISQVSAMINVGAATFATELPLGENVATLATDARCTLLLLKHFPQHLELGDFDTLDGAVADLLLRTIEYGSGTRGVRQSLGTLGPVATDESFERVHGRPLNSVFDTDPAAVESVLRARPPRPRGLVSIVTLSWNAPEFTVKALESIAKRTSEPYEVVVVDNGSGEKTLAMLRAIDDPHVRVIYNATNRGFAGGCNDGIAAARGEYVVLLNNDVIVTDGWLDGLLAPFERSPGIGVTAPRSNKVAGHQQLPFLSYESEAGLETFAAQRNQMFARSGYFTDRVIGLCLCASRTLLEQIGGLDERFGLGNFEDDDFCVRVRAAGYAIYVCDDVFIHHFGSQSFTANNVDYSKTMHENWAKFAAKWEYPPAFPTNGYNPRRIFARGFDRAAHYAPIGRPVAAEPSADEVAREGDRLRDARIAFYAEVHGERDWTAVAEFASRFARAFEARDRALLAIGVFDELAAETLGARVERIFRRAKIDPALSGDVEISDEDDVGAWRARFAATSAIEIGTLEDRSPSALRRLADRTTA